MTTPGQGPSAGADLRFLSGGGQMGRLMRAHDWAATPLGPPQGWPQSLRSSVSTCLNCSFPILLWWGRGFVKLYNDAYRPILGDKHPAALGRPGREVWPEIWPTIGPMLQRVIEQGEAAPADDLLLALHRHGYTEECYFSFSYSPIHDETGGVGGVFCPVLETTSKVIGARRSRTISDLGGIDRADSAETAAVACARVMADNPADLPFALIYLLDRQTGAAHLAGCAGLAPGEPAAPREIGPHDFAPWTSPGDVPGDVSGDTPGRLAPIGTHGRTLPDLRRGWPGMPAHLAAELWGEPPVEGFLQPIVLPGDAEPAALLIAGLSPRKRLDDDYRAFLSLVASQTGARIADAVALAAERRRVAALAELDRAKTTFFSNISHEFRTPLTLILGPLEEVLAAPAALPEADRTRLEAAHRNALRLLRLVNTLLDFAWVEAGRTGLQRRATDLAALTAELASLFRALCEQAGLELVADCPALPQPVWVDPGMWEKIVLNLLSNAFKFTFEGGIEVRLHGADGKAVLSVRDSGTGIPQDELPKLFERFHRVEGARGRSHEGSGIGLAVARDLVELHGGEITVSSAPGAGSCFTVLIPFGKAPAEPPAIARLGTAPPGTGLRAEAFLREAQSWLRADDSGAAAATDKSRLGKLPAAEGGRHILLVDDNTDMRDYVGRLLRGQAYKVTAVADGAAALRAARVCKPDLVLSDVMMPVMDGLALLRALRADPALADIPVLLLSARADETARVDGLDSGADDYLIKPFPASELLSRVNARLKLRLLRRQAVSRETVRLEHLVAETTAARDRVWRNARDILVVAGPDGCIRDVNPAWRATLGHAPNDIIGQRLQPFIQDPADGEAVPVRHQDGSTRWISWHITREEGGLYAYGRDVTAERQKAEALASTEDALRQSQKMDAVGQLTGGLAHDFNNLLTGIMGNLELLQMRLARKGLTGDGVTDAAMTDGEVPGDAANLDRYVAGARSAARRAAALTHRLLAFSRRQTLDPQPTGMNHLVDGMEEIIRRTVGPAIAVEVAADNDLWVTLADPNQLENALLNLCINARDAMPEGGRLMIATTNCRLAEGAAREHDMAPGDYVSLRVVDSGTGMPPEVIARAFDPFFTTKPAGMGTGLGLSMVYGFARQSGGQVIIDSAVGQGTTMRLLLPRFDGTVENRDMPPAQTAITRLDRKGTVLVVDDEPTVRSLASETLTELGCHVLEAADGAGGLQSLRVNRNIDVLVTDVGLPGGLNGRQLADAGRSLQPDLKVLFITGYAETAVVRDGQLETGMAVLSKPYSVDELVRRVTALIGSG